MDSQSLLTVFSTAALVAGSIAVGIAAFKLRAEDSWKRTAEQRKERITDLEQTLKRITQERDEALANCERWEQDSVLEEQRKFRLLGALQWYEREHGPIPPDENFNSRRFT